MSTLEKAIVLLHEMPEPALEAVYAFMQALAARQPRAAGVSEEIAFGIAHKYANPADTKLAKYLEK